MLFKPVYSAVMRFYPDFDTVVSFVLHKMSNQPISSFYIILLMEVWDNRDWIHNYATILVYALL